MVPKGRRHATSDVWAIGKAALRPLSLVYGAGGDRASSSSGLLHSRDCAPARSGGVDDLPGTAAQRCYSKRWPGISRDDGAMARRSSCSPPKAGKACTQCGIADLCGGTTRWRRRRSERGSCSRPGRILERPSAWTAARPAVGKRLEPGTDRPSPAGRLPRRWDHAHQPRSHLSSVVRSRSRGVAPRADGLLAHRAGIADAEGAYAQTRQEPSSLPRS